MFDLLAEVRVISLESVSPLRRSSGVGGTIVTCAPESIRNNKRDSSSNSATPIGEGVVTVETEAEVGVAANVAGKDPDLKFHFF
ncbi:Hypothetical protein FKW44_010274 [Caligus rogercresseyi]|uniref:Uncharacterized protein n=1 Tax=Caligus rogercresseyi TaxID=217165 RepID=A0A7T8HGD0_CALRO|nr:Hypothetical protein FKW44_010274 [Caligus rogercresseyi]